MFTQSELWNLFLFQNKVAPIDHEEKYIAGPRPPSATASVDEFYLLPQSKPHDFETQSFESHELNSLASTPASQRKIDIVTTESVNVKVRAKSVKTPDVFFANPGAETEADEKLDELDTNFDEVVQSGNIYTSLPTNNNNNNNNGAGGCSHFQEKYLALM